MASTAVSSLARIFEQMLQHQHVILPYRKLVESFLKEVNSIRYILEASSKKSSEEINSFRSQITNLAYRERRSLERHIRNQLPPDSELLSQKKELSIRFSSQFLKKVRAQINLLKNWGLEIEERSQLQDNLQPSSSSSTTPTLLEAGHHLSGKISVIPLYDDFLEVKDRLVRGSKQLQIVSVVGMGGIGKTTLATKVYNDLDVSNRFDIQAWVTISQSYNLQRTLLDILDSMKILTGKMSQESDVQVIKDYLYKKLKGRRYLIVMDDVWDSTFWYDLRQIFPNDSNTSRVLLTTRLEKVAVSAKSSLPLHRMVLLDENKSWNLFCHKVFGGDDSPPELKEIGEKMVQSCGGLPLAIVVLAGFLLKAVGTQDCWRSIAENLSSVVISSDERLSRMLNLSYTHLPPHLKECFLYAGIFPEDFGISVSKLVSLWVAEGFIKHHGSKNLEDVAYDYLLDLTDRNLFLVDKWSSLEKIEVCKIHDLVRDFCARTAKNDMSFHIADKSLYGVPAEGAVVHLLSVHPNKTNVFPCDEKKLSSLLVRSLVNFDPGFNISRLQHPGALIVVDSEGRFPINKRHEENGLRFYNMRYLACRYEYLEMFPPTSTSNFLNLQTLVLQYGLRKRSSHKPPIEVAIWNMPNLRHVWVDKLKIPEPVKAESSFVVLENLQTLSRVCDFRCSEEVVRSIPNLKELEVCHVSDSQEYCYLGNLINLCKLEAFRFSVIPRFSRHKHNITFPPSLKYLKLRCCLLAPKDMHIIGGLPNLRVLKLTQVKISKSTWEPAEGEFSNLKYLKLDSIRLESWKADSVHFPRLQRLTISRCILAKIPSGFGDILTLQLVKLCGCSKSFESSVEEMQEKQREWENDVLQVHIRH